MFEAVILEASTIGWDVGQWPDNFMHDGNRFYWERDERDDEGELQAVVYRDNTGRELKVLND